MLLLAMVVTNVGKLTIKDITPSTPSDNSLLHGTILGSIA